MEKLCKDKKFHIAKKFTDTHRFLDDINPKNNHSYFSNYKDFIYSPGLVINKENEGTTHTSILEIDMSIDQQSKTFTTNLFDKRDSFNFDIIKYPSLNSNIHSKVVYNIFVSQIIRYSRVCNKLHYFLIALKKLVKNMIAKGCKRSRLFKLLYKTLLKKEILTKYDISLDIINTHYIINTYINS